MIRVISIGTDRKVFEEGSAVRARLLKQRELFDELHVIVFSVGSLGLSVKQIGNLWLYPTNSLSRLFYVRDAKMLAAGLLSQRGMTSDNTVITAQDPFECGLAAFLASKKSKIPIQLQVHTDFLSPEFSKLSILNRIRVRIARYLLPKARGVRAVSGRIADSLRGSGLVSAVVGILPVFSAEESASFKAAKSNSPKGTSRVLMVSRFAPEKDIELGLSAIGHLRKEGEAVSLVIVGAGPEEGKIRKEIETRGLKSDVRLEPWQSATGPFHDSTDIFLLTSRFEGFGLVLLEAASHAEPIVTTDVGIARELIPQEYSRFICPVGDMECIAKGLRELGANPELRIRYGAALRASADTIRVPEKEYWGLYKTQLERLIKINA